MFNRVIKNFFLKQNKMFNQSKALALLWRERAYGLDKEFYHILYDTFDQTVEGDDIPALAYQFDIEQELQKYGYSITLDTMPFEAKFNLAMYCIGLEVNHLIHNTKISQKILALIINLLSFRDRMIVGFWKLKFYILFKIFEFNDFLDWVADLLFV